MLQTVAADQGGVGARAMAIVDPEWSATGGLGRTRRMTAFCRHRHFHEPPCGAGRRSRQDAIATCQFLVFRDALVAGINEMQEALKMRQLNRSTIPLV